MTTYTCWKSCHSLSIVFKEAYVRDATMSTAINGFARCGIWPCSMDVFVENEFQPSLSRKSPQASHVQRLLVSKSDTGSFSSPEPSSDSARPRAVPIPPEPCAGHMSESSAAHTSEPHAGHTSQSSVAHMSEACGEPSSPGFDYLFCHQHSEKARGKERQKFLLQVHTRNLWKIS